MLYALVHNEYIFILYFCTSFFCLFHICLHLSEKAPGKVFSAPGCSFLLLAFSTDWYWKQFIRRDLDALFLLCINQVSLVFYLIICQKQVTEFKIFININNFWLIFNSQLLMCLNTCLHIFSFLVISHLHWRCWLQLLLHLLL